MRAFRQELESLALAGLDRVPAAARIQNALAHPPGTAPTPVAATARKTPEEASIPSSADEPQPPQPVASNWLFPPDAVRKPSPPRAVSDPPIGAPPSSLLGPLFKEPAFENPPVPACDRQGLLDSLASVVAACHKCAYLAETRTQTVFGTGPAETRLMFVGEAPGADEDRQGKPFVGRAGQLLTDMITKGMGLAREQVYIANVLKCRPPENRTACAGRNGQLHRLPGRADCDHPAGVHLPPRQGGASIAPEKRFDHGPRPRQVVLLQRHPHDGHLPPLVPAPQARRQARDLGRSSNAHERDGTETAGTEGTR